MRFATLLSTTLLASAVFAETPMQEVKFSSFEDTPWTSFAGFSEQGEITLGSEKDVNVELSINGGEWTPHEIKAEMPLMVNVEDMTHNGTNRVQFRTSAGEGDPPILSLGVDAGKDAKENMNVPEYDWTSFDQFIQEQIDEGFPGAVVMVMKDNKPVKLSAYGYQKRYDEKGEPLANPEPMRTDTLFDLASNTKMYATNYALMHLVSAGKLDVNLPVSTYIPEYTGEGRENVLVRHVLTHSAGYEPEVQFFKPDNSLGAEFYSIDATKTRELLLKVPLTYPTGSKSVYSDTDYMLLGLLIEKITGMPLDEYAAKEIYEPLGLKNTMFNPLKNGRTPDCCAATELAGTTRDGRLDYPEIRKNVVQGEVHDEKAYYAMNGVAGHAGLFSTAEDLAVLTSAMLSAGTVQGVNLFNVETIDLFTKPSDHDLTFGLGWRRAGRGGKYKPFGAYASPYAFGHTGWTGIDITIDPAYNLTVILLTNKKHSKVQEGENSNAFEGDLFLVGKYTEVVSKVYETILYTPK